MGSHFSLVTELLGPSLQECIEEMEPGQLDLSLIRKIIKQVLLSLEYTHSQCGIVHTDVKASNYLMALPYPQLKAYYESKFSERKKEEEELVQSHKKELKIKKQLESLKNQEKNRLSKKERKKLKQKIKKAEQKMEETLKNKPGHRPSRDSREKTSRNEECDSRSRVITTSNSQHDYKKQAGERVHRSVEPSGGILPDRKMSGSISRTSNKNLQRSESTGSLADADVSHSNTVSYGGQKRQAKNGTLWKLLCKHNFKFKLIGFGDALWKNELKIEKMTTRPNRAPEIILEMACNEKIDVWSAGCLFFKLFSLEDLFKPRASISGFFRRDDDHLAQIIELLGPIPFDIAVSTPAKNKFFDKNGKLKKINTLAYITLEDILYEKYKLRLDRAQEIQIFLKQLLEIDSVSRNSPLEILNSDWFKTAQIGSLYMTDSEMKETMIGEKRNRSHQKYFNFMDELEPDLNYQADQEYLSEEEQSEGNLDDNSSSCSDPNSKIHTFMSNNLEGMVLDRSFGPKDHYISYDQGIDFNELDLEKDIKFKIDVKEDDIFQYVISA